MKRLFLFFLSLLLILCGCKQETEKSLRLTGNHRTDPYQVNSFFYRSSFNSEQDISLTLEDGSVLFWDGQTYQLMQKDATHTYADLSFRTSTERLDGGWNFITEFVLEDGDAGSVDEKGDLPIAAAKSIGGRVCRLFCLMYPSASLYISALREPTQPM